ncbi:alpha/beta hydrolase [bacterium]|nr:alpha/beta hydrolase [bacterium]
MNSPNHVLQNNHCEAVPPVRKEMHLDIGGQSVKVCWQDWGEEQKNSPPVLCLHAVNRVSDDFSALASYLASSRRVICPDLPGRGDSDYLQDPSLYRHQTYLKVMDSLLDVAGLTPDQPFDIVGTSLGGLLGIQFSAQYPDRVRRLILNDVGTFTPARIFSMAATSIAKPLRLRSPEQAVLIFKVMTSDCGPLSDEQWRLVSLPMVCPDGNGAFTLRFDPRISEQLERDAEKDLDLLFQYQMIKAPILLIRGENSNVFSADNAMQMQACGPRAKLLTISKTGHFPMLVKKVEIDAIFDFLSQE